MATSPQLPYRYSPLPSKNHIRVLEIHYEAEEDGPLKGTLRNVNLDDDMHLPYAALSYTWGKPDFSEKLCLDNTVKFITPNLASSLKRFRFVGHLRWIWVDAVCINQEDDGEKSFQIPLMARIYRYASYVMVWLGNQDQGVESMRIARSIATKASENPQEEGELDESTSSRVIEITRLPWFTRRWIIQELAMNSTVVFHCGPVDISWLQLCKVLLMAKKTAKSTSSLDSALFLRSLWLTWSAPRVETATDPSQSDFLDGNPTHMPNLLHGFEYFDCTDPRDRIYSISGLKRDGVMIDINYSHTMDEVFTNFAGAYANSKSDSDNLLFWILAETTTRQRGNRVDGLPSWVPDWRIPPTGRLPFQPHFTDGQSIRRSPNDASFNLTLNLFRDPSDSKNGEAPLTISWTIFRGERERFPYFVARVTIAVFDWHVANAAIDSDVVDEKKIWDWATYHIIDHILPWPWAIAGVSLAHSVSSLPLEKRHELGERFEEFWVKLQPMIGGNGHKRINETWMKFEATTRCFFVALPNSDAKPSLATSVVGMGFSDVRKGDKISAIDATMKTPLMDVLGGRINAGLVIRELPRPSRGVQRQDMTEGDAIHSHTPFEFVGCCYLYRKLVDFGWNSRLSDLVII